MAGLLSPEDASLMALGTGLLGGGTFAQAFGRGGQAALSTYAAMAQAQQEQAQREKEFALRELLGKAQLENYASEAAQRKAQTEALAQKERAAQQRLQSLPAIFGQAVPGDANMPGAPASGQFNPIAAMQSGWGVDDIPKLQNMPNLGRPKVARTIETMVNGRPVQQQLDEYGQPVGDPLAQWKAPVMTDLGGRVAATDPVTLAQLAAFDKTQTPDGLANNQISLRGQNITMRGQDMTDARAREAGSREALPQFNADAGGFIVRPTMQNPNGAVIPLAGFEKKLSEGQKKQLGGIESLSSAIGEYLAEMETWSNKRMLNPDARAKMGTKYNNMMLQAKEAYNLGVLNGPDLEILTSVIADPRKPASAFLSNDALTTQAKELRRMMTQTANATRSGGAGAGIQPGTIDGGYRFKGGNPADKSNWEKL